MIEPDKITDVARYGHNSKHSGELAMRFRQHLTAVIPAGERWIWPHLLETLPYRRGKDGDEARKPFVRAIRRLREHKVLNDCWEKCPNRTFLGSPVVLWKRPGDVDADPSQF